jgi:hypothetical protein
MPVNNQDYIISINNAASIISSELGNAVVESVFRKYGAHDIDDLNPAYLPEVFSELYAIEADLR